MLVVFHILFVFLVFFYRLLGLLFGSLDTLLEGEFAFLALSKTLDVAPMLDYDENRNYHRIGCRCNNSLFVGLFVQGLGKNARFNHNFRYNAWYNNGINIYFR